MIVNASGGEALDDQASAGTGQPARPGPRSSARDTGAADPNGDTAMNRDDIQAELRRAQADFHDLVARASAQDLRRRSDGTRWSNRQLLWHMVFGYLIVRTLLPLVHTLGRLNRSRRFAAALDAAHRPFHWINHAGSAGGGLLLTPHRMAEIGRA